METAIAVITHPISLCAYVLSLAFGLVAKKKKAHFFYFAASLSVVALIGGLVLAWQQIDKNSEQGAIKNCVPAGSTTTQTSKGAQSPNISQTCGDVNLKYETPSVPPTTEPEKAK